MFYFIRIHHLGMKKVTSILHSIPLFEPLNFQNEYILRSYELA